MPVEHSPGQTLYRRLAIAADLPSRKAPPQAYIPPPILSWQGFYVGVNGGGMWSNFRVITTTGTNLGVDPRPPLCR